MADQRSTVDERAQTFEHVASLDEFVDTTMLIKDLLEKEPNHAMIFAPSKFGKTVKLDMIRFFCDIENKATKTKEDVAKDPTMKELRSHPSKKMKVLLRQFKDKQYDECLILKEEKFVIQHFGRHPVILFDFKNCNPKDESQALFACAQQVKKGYLDNHYLQNSKEFRSIFFKETCKKWCSYNNCKLAKLLSTEVIKGLQVLIQSLRIHWRRQPVFLVDEIDKPCVAALKNELSDSQVRNIITTIMNVICSILNPKRKEFGLQAALVTGVYKLRNAGLSPVDNAIEVYISSDARFSQYYQFSAEGVNTLVRKFYASEGDYYQRASDEKKSTEIFREKIVPESNETFNFPNFEIKQLSNLPKGVTSEFISCGKFFKALSTDLEISMQNSKKFHDDLSKLCAELTNIFKYMNCHNEITVCSYILTILKLSAVYDKAELNYKVQFEKGKRKNVFIDVWGQHGSFALILEAKHNRDANSKFGKIGLKIKNSLAAAEDIVELLPKKQQAENKSSRKAGTGRDLKVLNPAEMKTYLLMGLTVDGDGTTHILVFPNSTEWKNVIAVHPEDHVAEVIKEYLPDEDVVMLYPN